MPDDDRSRTVNAAQPGTVRSDEATSSEPSSTPAPARAPRPEPNWLALVLTVTLRLLRPGATRLRVAVAPGLTRLRAAVAPRLTRLAAQASEAGRAVTRFAEPRLRSGRRFAATRIIAPGLLRARRFAAFRAGERALRRAARIAAPRIGRLLARASALATRVGLPDPRAVRHPGRTVAAVGLLCCLGLVAVVQSAGQPNTPAGAAATGPEDQVALSRSDASDPDTTRDDTPNRSSRSTERDRSGSAGSARDRSEPADPLAEAAPVAGLSRVQMDNARAIVRTGRDMGMPRRALVIGVATAMQESNLLNRASEVLPDSKRYPHQGTGWDHDSVGLFQQRTSSGWGPVHRLMDPAYATARFFEALRQVPGWERMRLTEAAQAVQVSAYPEHYAQHENEAAQVVDALVPTRR